MLIMVALPALPSSTFFSCCWLMSLNGSFSDTTDNTQVRRLAIDCGDRRDFYICSINWWIVLVLQYFFFFCQLTVFSLKCRRIVYPGWQLFVSDVNHESWNMNQGKNLYNFIWLCHTYWLFPVYTEESHISFPRIVTSNSCVQSRVEGQAKPFSSYS